MKSAHLSLCARCQYLQALYWKTSTMLSSLLLIVVPCIVISIMREQKPTCSSAACTEDFAWCLLLCKKYGVVLSSAWLGLTHGCYHQSSVSVMLACWRFTAPPKVCTPCSYPAWLAQRDRTWLALLLAPLSKKSAMCYYSTILQYSRGVVELMYCTTYARPGPK